MLVYFFVIISGFLVGLPAGYIMHRTDYCMAGMFRDFFMFRSRVMLNSFVLFLATSMFLFHLFFYTGLIHLPLHKFGIPSISNLLGGFLFGIGMVLAGACAVGILYKMGAGSLPAMIAFTGMILGSLLFAMVYPAWSLVAKNLKLPTDAITLPELLRVPAIGVVIPLLLVMLFFIRSWIRNGKMLKPVVVDGYIQPWKSAIALALLSVCFTMLIGIPMGVTTSNAKLAGLLLKLAAPDLYAGNHFFNAQSFTYNLPFGGGLLKGGPGADFDAVSLIQLPLITGIIAGSATSALRLGEWRIHLHIPLRQLLSALAGGVIMGVASRMAPSCNLWHLYGGLPILSLQSILFLAGIIPGSWIGGIILARYVIPSYSR